MTALLVGVALSLCDDLAHPHLIANPGVPAWWPMFCMAYDVAAAAWLAWLLRQPARANQTSTMPSR